MASNIDYQNINDGYPIAGRNQTSQGFRDNFGIIKNSLNAAKEEIESLQATIENSPTITEVSELVNDSGFVTIDGVESYLDAEDYLDRPGILELLAENNYTTVADVNDILADGQYVNQTTLADTIRDAGYITIDQIDEVFPELGEVSETKLDSIQTTATPTTTLAKTNTLTLTSPELIQYFVIGQHIRIFGASNDQAELVAPILTGVTKNGAIDGATLVEYKIFQFEYSTGKFSPPSGVLSQSVNLLEFNTVNNIALTFSRTSPNNGLLVYRKIESSLFELIAVLGTNDLDLSLVGTYIDYLTFDYTEWSRKKSSSNSYDSSTGVVHFPAVAPVTASLGWVDTKVASVDSESFRITVETSYFYNSTVTIVHDDTQTIQTAITAFKEKNQNILKLGSKVYYVSSLTIPNNFSIVGDSRKTLIKKLPWSSGTSNKIFKSATLRASDITIENLEIDGNMQNQYLVSNAVDDSANYAVDIPGDDVGFSNLFIDNTINGAISSRESSELIVKECRLSNAGMSDRYSASPLFADFCSEIIISANVMKNFSDSVDLTLTDIGSVVGNIVNNCGAGILIFGSTKLVSSPNLILGPAGEYIPGPDIFNSEFNAVNIVIERDVSFISDEYVYQENGQLFNLSANGGTVTYRVNKLRKIDNVEEIGDEVLINGSTPITPLIGPDLTKGEFRFSITADKTTILKTDFSYSQLKTDDPDHVGLVYRAFLTEYPVVANIDPDIIPTIIVSSGNTFYTIRLSTVNQLGIGLKVKLLNHGQTGTVLSGVGTVTGIQQSARICEIRFAGVATDEEKGEGGQLTVENTFVLAKGKIQ